MCHIKRKEFEIAIKFEFKTIMQANYINKPKQFVAFLVFTIAKKTNFISN